MRLARPYLRRLDLTCRSLSGSANARDIDSRADGSCSRGQALRGAAVGLLGLMLYNKTPYRDLLQASNGPEDGPSSLMPVTWWGCGVCRSNGVHTFPCPVHGLGRGVHRE